jgi:hypothetical protein
MHLFQLLMLLGLSILPRPLLAQKDVLGGSPPSTLPDLLVHPRGTDLSAYRVDCEVFGWNKGFSEVAAVGTEIRRGPRGKHRGEAFLLVYPFGQPIPTHNVIAHNITHADLPNDPIPIEDARDLMWVIENSFQEMWPRRPQHKRPKGGMAVETLWDPWVVQGGLCKPLVGFALKLGGRSRFQQFMPVDMKVDCRNLKHSDTRVYWGKSDVAVAMPRFDFSASPSNEKSARFVVSAVWKLAKELNIVVHQAALLPRPARNELLTTLRKLGSVHLQGGDQGARPGAGGTLGVVKISTTANYEDLARYLARSFSAADVAILGGHIEDVADGFPDVVVQVGVMPERPQRLAVPHSGADVAPAPALGPVPAAGPVPTPALPPQRYAPSAMPPPAPEEKPAAPPPAAKYLDNFPQSAPDVPDIIDAPGTPPAPAAPHAR